MLGSDQLQGLAEVVWPTAVVAFASAAGTVALDADVATEQEREPLAE